MSERTAANTESTGTPPTADFNPDEDLVQKLAIAGMSAGSTRWLVADREPGPHVLACFVANLVDELPHALHGMVLIADVERLMDVQQLRPAWAPRTEQGRVRSPLFLGFG